MLWPLRALRAIGQFSASVLYIPLLTQLLTGFTCANGHHQWWQESGFTCYVGGHVVQTVIAALLTAAFVFLSSLFALVFYEANPLSSNIAAKAHGRVEFCMVVIKTVRAHSALRPTVCIRFTLAP